MSDSVGTGTVSTPWKAPRAVQRRVDSVVGDVLDRAAMESETKHPTVEVDEWAIRELLDVLLSGPQMSLPHTVKTLCDLLKEQIWRPEVPVVQWYPVEQRPHPIGERILCCIKGERRVSVLRFTEPNAVVAAWAPMPKSFFELGKGDA